MENLFFNSENARQALMLLLSSIGIYSTVSFGKKQISIFFSNLSYKSYKVESLKEEIKRLKDEIGRLITQSDYVFEKVENGIIAYDGDSKVFLSKNYEFNGLKISDIEIDKLKRTDKYILLFSLFAEVISIELGNPTSNDIEILNGFEDEIIVAKIVAKKLKDMGIVAKPV